MADSAGFTLTFENLKSWCVRQQFEHRTNDQAGQLAIAYQLLGQQAPLLVLPQPSRAMVMLVMRQPFAVAPERRGAVLDACARLNVTLFMGAWVLNQETGELFFRVTIPALDVAYSDQALVHCARVVIGTSEKAAPALKSIALDGADPAKAIAAIQLPS